MRYDKSQGFLGTALVSLFIMSLYVWANYEPYTYGNGDPGWMMLATISLVEDLDLDLKNQLNLDPKRAWDQVSLGARGEWYPLHEWLISLYAVPWYYLFGLNGTLLSNMCLSLLIVLLTYDLSVRFFSPLISFFCTVLTYVTSLLLPYTYSFSVDVFGVFLTLLSLALLFRNRYLLAGLFISMSIIGRNIYALLLPAYICLIIHRCYFYQKDASSHSFDWSKTGKNVLFFIAGGLPGLFCFLLMNYLQYGSVFSLSYQNWMRYDQERSIFVMASHSFNRSILEGLKNLFFSPKEGLFTGIPLLVLGLIFGTSTLYKKAPYLLTFFLISFFSLGLFVVQFQGFPGSPGNRYLMLFAPLSVWFLGGMVKGGSNTYLRLNNSL
jgi:hypothetical protein